MGKLRRFLTSTAAVALASLPGCVELTGQRITLKYDKPADRLVIFVAYDGIHDNPEKGAETGAEQFAEFVRDGDVLFLDWFGHVDRADLRKLAADPEARPAVRELARMTAETVETEAVGHYFAPDGQVGALQRIVIPAASRYVRQVNAAIDEAVLAAAVDGEGLRDVIENAPRTLKRMEAAARDGHRWLTLDGSSLRLSFPVHAREWARVKARFLEDVLEEFAKAARNEKDDDELKPKCVIQALVAGPLSVVERDGTVEITFGDRNERTSRFSLRDHYSASMEQTVRTHVPSGLDAAIAARLLEDRPNAGSAAIDEFVRWGPPEDRVRAILAVATGEADDERQAATAWLTRFAIHWNAAQGHPMAPTDPADLNAWTEQWAEWYRRMLAFPL